ncbi:MAG: FAD-dependent oxidoreductase [Candidatus Heimdallarchaeota archaeon]
METISVTIDGMKIEARKGATILEATQNTGIYIPSLCAHPDLPPMPGMKPADVIFRGTMQIKNEDPAFSAQGHDGCRLCVVKIEGMQGFPTSCSTPVEEGIRIWTNTPEIQDLRRERLMHILSTHPHACLICAQQEGCSREPCSTNVPVEERCCPEFGRCELQKVAEYIGIREDTPRYVPRGLPILEGEPLFIRNYELCISCTRCVRVCNEVRGVGALGFVSSNGETVVGSIAPTLKESGCKFCGACVEVCPTGALSDKDILWADRERMLVPCRDACPLGVDVPHYIRLIADGKFGEASAVIRAKTPFPSVLGRVCFHVCEEKCRRGQLNEPIAICALKRFATEQESGMGLPETRFAPTTGKKVAVVGSGPAGLTAAYYLARVGHSVTVFEASSYVGGMMRLGIPEYRLPREILREELGHILNVGVALKTDTIFGKHVTLDELKSQGYAAIFLAIGAQQPKRLQLEGIELEGVLWGLELLKHVNLGQEVKVEDRVLVIGGGGVAIDAGLTALRLGAKEVQLACLESREEMPAHEWEIQEALEEQITLNCSWGPKRILGTNGKVSGVELIQCTSVFDEDGKFNPSFDETITKSIEADMVIMAIGQIPDLSPFGTESPIRLTPEGLIPVDEEAMVTDAPGIFAGGEATKGPLSVVEAIEMGKKAARSIDKYLGGTGEIDEPLIELVALDPWLGRDESFFDKPRIPMPRLPLPDRLCSFSEIELGFNESMAVDEANRCLRCDFRLQISPVILPPEKWLAFSVGNVQAVPETEGVFQLLNEEKQIIHIKGTPNLRQALEEQLNTNEKARYFIYEEDPMYTKRESELLQRYLQEFGRLPEGEEELEDLF